MTDHLEPRRTSDGGGMPLSGAVYGYTLRLFPRPESHATVLYPAGSHTRLFTTYANRSLIHAESHEGWCLTRSS